MQFKFFIVPILSSEESGNDLNKFLRSHRVLEESHELVTTKNGAYWHFCVKYLDSTLSKKEYKSKVKVNYQEVLSEKNFKKFLIMKKIRKSLADMNAMPAYAIFTDHELSEICKLDKLDVNEISNIPGIGKSKVDKYTQIIITRFKEFTEDEKNKQSI